MKENSNFKAIFALPKWAKVFLATLSVVAVAGLITAFSLKSWAADKVESGELVLNGIDNNYFQQYLAKQSEASESQETQETKVFAYDGRLYFARLDFLLRSKVIAYIDIQGISWAENIDKNAVSEVKSRNRHIRFITSQDLQGLNAQNIGKVEYKMDFSPLPKTILKYYFIILLVFYGFVVLYKMLESETHTKKIISTLTQNSLPSVLWQGYKSINPLYRHSFWILFIACNVVYFFHTAQFLWGREDVVNTAFDSTMGTWTTASEGRYTQNLQIWLHNHWILPVLNNVLSFVALSISGILISVYLGLQKKLWLYVVVGLCFCIEPFILGRLYYTYQAAGLFIGAMVGILGFVLAKRAGEFSPVCNGGGGATLSIRRI